MVAISEGRPKLMGLREIIESYLNHQIEVVTNRTRYDLEQAEKRMHIVEGLMKALSILDEVIALIRNSKNKKMLKIIWLQSMTLLKLKQKLLSCYSCID